MGGFLAAVLGGALEGVGSGMTRGAEFAEQEARDKRNNDLQMQREAFLENLRGARQEALQKSSQEFQASENTKSRGQAAALQQEGFSHTERMAAENQAFQLNLEKVRASDQRELVRLSKSLEDAAKNNDVINVQADEEGKMFGITRSGKKIDLDFKGSKPLTESVRALSSAVTAANNAAEKQVEKLQEQLQLAGKDDAKKADIQAKIDDLNAGMQARTRTVMEALSPGITQKIADQQKASQTAVFEQRIKTVPDEARMALMNNPKLGPDFKRKYGIDPDWVISKFKLPDVPR